MVLFCIFIFLLIVAGIMFFVSTIFDGIGGGLLALGLLAIVAKNVWRR
jgi:hypothetical protein